MKIGVITPVYNDATNIVECIKSVREQNYNGQIIHYIFNDGSTDDTEQVLDFIDNIVVCHSPTNVGVSTARNNLIELAIQDGCDYIAFLDADDRWLPNHLRVALSCIENDDIIYTSPIHQFANGVHCSRKNIPVPKQFIGKHLMYGNFIYLPCVVAKTSCFIDNKFDTKLNGLEDWDMWYRLWEKGFKFANVLDKTVIHIVHENTMASRGIGKMNEFRDKHKTLNNLKLHLACGTDYHDDYINIDLYADAKVDARFDVSTIPYEDNSIDEIKAFHIIEHFDFHKTNDVIREWFRVLKPGGRLYIETPDLTESCRLFVKAYDTNDLETQMRMYGHMFSEPWSPGQAHLFLFSENQLRAQLSWAGFKQINKLPAASRYLQWHPPQVFLTLEGFK